MQTIQVGQVIFEHSLKGLKNFMSPAKSVEDWNILREEAKRFFSRDLIKRLDQSGYIVKLLDRNYE